MMDHKVSTASGGHKLLLFSLFLIALSVGFIVMVSVKKNTPKQMAMLNDLVPTAMPKPSGPVMRLTPSSRGTTYEQGKPITLTVYADSLDEPIVGFDAVIKYNPDLVTYNSVSTALSDYKVVDSDKNGTLYLTGIQDFGSREKITFNQTAIATVTFIASSKGDAQFDLQFSAGKTDESNLMNTQTQDVLTQVSGVEVTIK